MSSSNPFRKATTAKPEPFDTSAIPRASQPPPPVSFRASSSTSSPEPETPAQPQQQPKKKKVVKKVRVLSPPPLSPDSPEWPHDKPWEQPQQASYSSAGVVQEEQDPFVGSDSTPGGSGRGTPPQQGNYDAWNSQSGAPQVLRDNMEAKEGEALKIGNGNAGGKGMDVSAFQRLLMTGNKAEGSLDGAQDQPPNITGQKELEEPEADDDLSDSSMTVQFGRGKKAPPPPPSSRHGKSITTAEFVEEPSQTDISKKPAPAPPPRRGHSRAESRATTKDDGPPSPTKPLAHGNRSSTYAPAPPPPRRPHTATRSQTSPTTSAFPTDITPPTQEVTPEHDVPVPKISAPPPPPARNTSVRRPPSASSMDAPSRQVSAEGRKPPPPPARKRGSSKGSMDVPRTMEEEEGQGKTILSDLEALQKEVDALRGKMG